MSFPFSFNRWVMKGYTVTVVDCMYMSAPNVCVEAAAPRVTVFGDGASGGNWIMRAGPLR